jgi:hypothetical protein
MDRIPFWKGVNEGRNEFGVQHGIEDVMWAFSFVKIIILVAKERHGNARPFPFLIRMGRRAPIISV